MLVVVLVATHALFLTLHAGGSALDLYLPAAGWGTFTGVFALVLLVGLVVTSLVGRLSYQTFVLIQQLLGAAFILAALHTFAIGGTAATSPALTIYLGCLTTAGIASLGYRVFGGPLGIGRYRYCVDEVRQLDDDAVEIVMTPVGRPLTFQAGQFVYATFHQVGIPRESHPFTIASAPGDDSLRFAVKRFGDFTSSMMRLRPGSQAQLEGPFGCFYLRNNLTHSQTWIAGGIGVTPFLSWARSLNRSIPADLYYCTPGAEHAHFLDELRGPSGRGPLARRYWRDTPSVAVRSRGKADGGAPLAQAYSYELSNTWMSIWFPVGAHARPPARPPARSCRAWSSAPAATAGAAACSRRAVVGVGSAFVAADVLVAIP